MHVLLLMLSYACSNSRLLNKVDWKLK